jgi:hypothetical protein
MDTGLSPINSAQYSSTTLYLYEVVNVKPLDHSTLVYAVIYKSQQGDSAMRNTQIKTFTLASFMTASFERTEQYHVGVREVERRLAQFRRNDHICEDLLERSTIFSWVFACFSCICL